MQRVEQVTAGAMTVAGTAALGTWVATATDLVQLAAAVVALVVGVYTALYYKARWTNERSNTNESKRSDDKRSS
jgi:hypothetical protein